MLMLESFISWNELSDYFKYDINMYIEQQNYDFEEIQDYKIKIYEFYNNKKYNIFKLNKEESYIDFENKSIYMLYKSKHNNIIIGYSLVQEQFIYFETK